MKLEYIPSALDGAPLVRLYDFNVEEARQLAAVCRGLAGGAIGRRPPNSLPWIKSVGGLVMALAVDTQDRGLVRQADGSYVWSLRVETWDLAAGRVEPFVQGQQGFAGLDERDSGSLLLSGDGRW
jgi:hypothetical protein